MPTHRPSRPASTMPRLLGLALCCCALAAARAATDEAALLRQLASPDAAARDAARHELLACATPASIPGLAAQLAQPDTFDNACFLLEALKLPEADAALADALSRTSGREQAGLLDALSRRRSALAADAAARLCAAAPEPVKSAALRYYYGVAAPSGKQAGDLPAADLHSAEALLLAAERLEGSDRRQAAARYDALARADLPDHLRLAAFCGLLRADTGNTAKHVTEGLSNPSPVWRGTTARLAAQLPDKTLNKLGAKLMASLPPDARLALARALVAAKKPAGAPLLRAALADESDAPTRLVAAAGIGVLGDADDADALIALLGSADAALADAARMSLITLADPKTDARLVRALGRPAGADARARQLGVIAFRKSPRAAPKLTPLLADPDAAVRTAAFVALTELAQPEQCPDLFAAVCRARDPKEQRAADKALATLARNHPQAATDAIRPLLATAAPECRSALLRALGLAGTPDGLGPVLAALKDPDPAVADDALRVLADWKTLPAAAPLLEQAKSHPKNSLRTLALRGYIRLIPQAQDLGERAAMCQEAAALCSRPEERLLLAGAYATVPTPATAAALQAWLTDPALKAEALKALKAVALHTPVDLPDAAPNSLLTPLTFVPHRLNDHRSEACAVADFNGDGRLDIAAGPYLYLAPDWKPVQIREVSTTVTDDGKGYADDFCNLVLDVNRDGKPDIVSGGWFNKTSFWFENTCGKPGLWPVHVIDPLGNHETGTLEDIDGDGKALEFLPQSHITVWYELGAGTNGQPSLVRHTVSEKKNKLGAGAGDINGDGRPDILRPDAWFEAPKDLRTGTWTEHPLAVGGTNGTSDHSSNILVFDVNRDGLNDIIASVAHKHGLWWYEQRRDAAGALAWTQHLIDDSWSQPHYLCFADIDQDGNREIVTGKRFMAHNGNDPDEYGKLCVFYYRFKPGPDPVFRKHVVSYDEGVSAGLNIVAADMDGDGDTDLVTTGKWGGPVLFENRMTEWISPEERRAALTAFTSTAAAAAPAYGDNLALAKRGATAAADSELEGAKGCTARLNDGDAGSYTAFAQKRWHSALTPMPHWAEVRLPKPAKVGRVIARFADPGGYATAFDIQVRQGDAYKTVFSKEENRSAQPVNVTFAPVQTDAVRFVFRKNANADYPNAAQLSELEAYAQ